MNKPNIFGIYGNTFSQKNSFGKVTIYFTP